MSFSLSNTTITQSGTDTDLSGLASIAGVSVTTYGSNDSQRSVYNLGALTLNFTGTQSINPFKEKIVHNAVNSVRFNGTLTVDGRRTINGVIFYSKDTWLESTRGSSFTSPNIVFGNGCALFLYGGRIYCPSGFRLRGSLDAENIIINTQQYRDDGSLINSQRQVRFETTNVRIDGLFLDNARLALLSFPQSLARYTPTQMNFALSFSSSSPNRDLVLSGYNSDGSHQYDVALWGGNRTILKNSVNGSALRVGPNTSRNNSSYGIVVVMQEFNPQINTGSGGDVAGGKIYFQDYDNGGRVAYTRENYLTTPGLAFDATTTKTYQGILNSSGNLDTNLEVVTAVISVEVGNTNTGLRPIDHRSKNNNSDDEFDVFVGSYKHNFASFTAVLKGGFVVTNGTTVFADTSISETDKAVVASYTEIDTAAKFYDAAKLFLIDNYVGQTIPLVYRTDDTIDAGSYNVIVDPSASQVFDFDGSSIILKASVFSGSLSTTGAVTLQNGAVVNGVLQDSTGTVYPISVEVLDEQGNPIQDALVYVDDNAAGAGLVDGLTNSSGLITSSYASVSANAVLRVRKYGFKFFVSQISLGSAVSVSVTLIADPQQN